MGAFARFGKRLRRRPAKSTAAVPEERGNVSTIHDSADEERLHAALHEDPNDTVAFTALADLVRARAAEGHLAGDPQMAEDYAVWALAEEMAHDQRSWYALIELARLSLHDDREAAMRRLGVASERDPTGTALAQGLALLRESGDYDAALGLGMGHWRPEEHSVAAGRELVVAAVEANRLAEARRHLDALASHPDSHEVEAMRPDLERYIAAAERSRRS